MALRLDQLQRQLRPLLLALSVLLTHADDGVDLSLEAGVPLGYDVSGTGGRHALASLRVAAWFMHVCTSGG